MTVSLDRIIETTITRATRTASLRSFGTIMIAAYHTAFPERVREYEDASDMLDDGFSEFHPAFLAAVSLCSQDPRPPTFKVGRRAGTPDQTLRFTPSTPSAGEVYSIEVGGVLFEYTSDATPTVAEITAALVLLINADVDAVIATGGVSTAGIQTLSGATLNGIRGDGPFAPPRNLTFTFNAHADWDATTIVVTGTDPSGRTITENFLIVNGGGTTVTGTKVFATIDTIVIPAQSGVGGTYTAGLGLVFENADLDITPTDGTTYLDISADDAGAWFAYVASTNFDVDDRTAEPGTTIASDLNAIEDEDADWIALVVADAHSSAQILAAAAWAETQKVLYLAHSFDSDCEDATDQDVLSAMLALGYTHSGVFYNRASVGLFPEAAIFGVVLVSEPGTTTFAIKQLVGILADDLSSTVVSRLVGSSDSPQDSKRALIYVEVLPTGTNIGTAITMGGLSSGGEWLDNVRDLYFTESKVQEKAFNFLLNSSRVPYTKKGTDAFVGSVRAAMKACSKDPNPIFDPDTLLVEGTAFEDVADEQKLARHYDGVRVDARFQSAIHSGRVRITVRP